MNEHTKEPWAYYELEDDRFGVKIPRKKKTRYGAEPYAVIGGFEPEDRDEMKANARRICSCINACAGIDTEYLESPDNLATYARNMAIQRDELLAALKDTNAMLHATILVISDSDAREMIREQVKQNKELIAKVENEK